ncbi:MAG: cation-transporting P-type ATPase [Candidatus Edwardsbacteria bacterium]|nr:cation-transporting P-type ATPase [Candidatus Edwardsbacteria bacterium]
MQATDRTHPELTRWHALTADQAVSLASTDPGRGLDPGEAARRLARHGPNAIAGRAGTNPLVLFLAQFNQPMVYLLLLAGLVTALLGEWVDSGVILGVVLVNAVVGFIQESKAIRAIDSLAKAMVSEATVLRDGRRQRINAAALTLGDIVLLQSGDKVPADLRLLQVKGLQVDESALTGESVPVGKETGPLPRETVLADRTNIAYSSTLVTYGAGTGLVAAVGNNTEIGRINQMIAAADVLTTPLTRQLARFSAFLLKVIMALASLTFLVGLLHGDTVKQMFMVAVALSVSAIPEGLPAALTITLAIGVSVMARRHAIVRKLPAVETLGSTSVICSDKTGTLTQNQMTVQRVAAGGLDIGVEGAGYWPQGQFRVDGARIDPGGNPALRRCLLAGLLCNDAELREDGGRWRIEGDPTEGALVVSATKAGLSHAGTTARYQRLDTLPFESQHQYMATLHRDPEAGGCVVFLKGSTESLMARCDRMLSLDGSESEIDPESIRILAEGMARQGLRVLAFAQKAAPGDQREIAHRDVAGGMVFLGLQAMIDPPRPEAIEAVATCRRAGIAVKMITGDHELTALAVAHRLGIVDTMDRTGGVMNGQAISATTDGDLIGAARRVSVFARVAPEDKLRLVKALQADGDVIAMTGDGVNDAPSLRQADIGIAMGLAGTDVAKETADMILTDDNFATIKAAVEEGRGVYDNIVKFITWTLPTNFGESLVVLAAVAVGAVLPITPLHILWINMTTAVLMGLTLAFEPKEPSIMDRPPRPPRQPLLTKDLLFRIGLVGVLLSAGAFGLFELAQHVGRSLDEARTIAVNTFVVGEACYLFNCRSLRHSAVRMGPFSNRTLLFGVGTMMACQVLFTYMPAMNRAFGSAPLRLWDWVWVFAIGVVIYQVVELEKRIRRGADPARPR